MEQTPRKRGRPKLFLTKEMIEERKLLKCLCKNTRRNLQAAPREKEHRRVSGPQVYKSGPLFLSSRGIGWTSWKKRWFILTSNSLVFFRSDPNVVPPKGSEANLTLGGIDLNSSGSVVVKADKKLLTVLFPDGRDGRAFTFEVLFMLFPAALVFMSFTIPLS